MPRRLITYVMVMQDHFNETSLAVGSYQKDSDNELRILATITKETFL